jgi:hypothetical protein
MNIADEDRIEKLLEMIPLPDDIEIRKLRDLDDEPFFQLFSVYFIAVVKIPSWTQYFPIGGGKPSLPPFANKNFNGIAIGIPSWEWARENLRVFVEKAIKDLSEKA